MTRAGFPVLVELERATDTRLRREVVGQMLDYAANGTAHWKAGVIAASFAVTASTAGRDPGAGKTDLSCAQLQGGFGIPRYSALTCPLSN